MPLAAAGASNTGGLVARFLSAVGRARRVPSKGWKVLSSKQAPRGLSKGKRCARTGVQGPDGRFRQVAAMLPTYVLPPGGLLDGGGSGAAADGTATSSSPAQPLLRPYVAEYPQEQLDAAVASLRARMAAQAARTERLDAERRARALEAARRMRWEQQGQREQAPPPGAAAAAAADDDFSSSSSSSSAATTAAAAARAK
jgi:hypothetical protein